ncbi:hypothetical protein K466DRAFT_459449, partial [Polyporus arcularius HHB13444]
WVWLYEQIERWLVDVVVDRRSKLWIWGREAFWIAFVGAYPAFPGGEWPNWNPCISMDGEFIRRWVETQGDAPNGWDDA